MSTFESLAFYRGVSVKYPTDRPSIITPRRDRRPKNTSKDFHDVADDWFKSRFGIAYRSCGLFVTSKLLSATTYAATPDHVIRVIPLSGYRYCWSPTVTDLLYVANKMATSSAETIESYLDSVGYREVDLEDAHTAGHEVMLYCEQYVSIPVHLLGKTNEPNISHIILPG